MERRRITVFDKSKEFQKIEQNKCNEMIINDILNPLLQIIYALRESDNFNNIPGTCLLYTSPSPRDRTRSRMPSSA